MRTKFLIALIIAVHPVLGQQVIVLEDTTRTVNLAVNAQYLEDTAGSLRFADIKKPEIDNQFVPVNNQLIAFGVSGSFFWIRMNIINKGRFPQFLKISNNSLTDIEVFETLSDSLVKYYHTGNWMPFNNREVKNIDHLISLQAPRDISSTVYLRVMHKRGTQFPLYARSLTAFYAIDVERSFWDGIYYGLMLLMILYNLFIYFSLNDKSYLYYVVYIFFISMLNASMDGYAFRYFWPNQPLINRYEDIWAALSGIAALLFAVNFLNTKETLPAFHKTFAIIFFGYLVAIVVIASGYLSIGMIANESITLLLIVCIFMAAYLLVRKGYKPAKLFLIAWTLLLSSAIVFILKDYTILPYNAVTVNALQIGSAIEALLLSIALADRISIYRREKAKAQEELIESLHEKSTMQHHMLELESAALRSQMDPHFIFNCMNSIKALIKQKEESKAIEYLTTFSKLLRTILQNAEKREITLFDEIEPCGLYLKLESMRFESRFNYAINIDETLDLKSVSVPALIIQPFIENALWHGLLHCDRPGILKLCVEAKSETIQCIIDDNGIGREQSSKNRVSTEIDAHQSRGINLTQSRLNIDNALNRRNTVVRIIDKKSEEGDAAGTTVILTFKEY